MIKEPTKKDIMFVQVGHINGEPVYEALVEFGLQPTLERYEFIGRVHDKQIFRRVE